MLNIEVPIIERLADGDLDFLGSAIVAQIHERRNISELVKGYFSAAKHGRDEVEIKDKYYSAIAKLLVQEEYERILLYFPLSDLKNAPQKFKEAYMKAWYSLLNRYDVRENFFEGDTYEPEARPNGQVELVVKCIHLTPWLLEAGYIGYSDIKRILTLGKDDDILMQSFAETWRIIGDYGLLAKTQLELLQEMTANVPPRKQLRPLFISEKRKKWLAERDQDPGPLVTPNANLTGPFSQNVDILHNGLEAIQSELKPNEIALVTGSRLKGYGTQKSDWDVFKLETLERDKAMRPGSPQASFLFFNAFWLGGSEVKDLAGIALQKAKEYFGRNDRKMSIERIEIDLLQYRLLHKGYKIFYSGYDSVAECYPEIDGNCPFYDDGYRRIATELFVKYVFIPQEI